MHRFFKSRVVARAAGVSKKTLLRRARRLHWRERYFGNRCEVVPQLDLVPLCLIAEAELNKPSRCRTITLSFSDLQTDVARLRAVLRASAVLFNRELMQAERWTFTRAWPFTARCFAPLLAVSQSSLSRWTAAFDAAGLDALVDQKIGRVGRKPKAFGPSAEAKIQAGGAAGFCFNAAPSPARPLRAGEGFQPFHHHN